MLNHERSTITKYRLLGKSGLRVSESCLGTMGISSKRVRPPADPRICNENRKRALRINQRPSNVQLNVELNVFLESWRFDIPFAPPNLLISLESLGSVSTVVRVCLFFQSGEPAADHAVLQRHEADRAEPDQSKHRIKDYSCRRASIGSTLEALIAGTHPASKATPSSRTPAPTSESGSDGCSP